MIEDELIHRIARSIPSKVGHTKGDVQLGIGDDAAILSSRRRRDWVVSCDAFIDGTHFLSDLHTPDSVGYKALARATSDLVALGARPRFFLLSLALPSSLLGLWLDAFLEGMARSARVLGMKLIGGDTTTAKILSASLTVFGEIEQGRGLTRSGAHHGDLIYISGKLGLAQFGLELMQARRAKVVTGGRKVTGELETILRPHLYPRIRVELGGWLSRNRIPSAMMDLSDGLSTDLTRLCVASGVAAKLWSERIPTVSVAAALGIAGLNISLDPFKMALHGGDDYELLFTVSRRNEKRLRNAPGSRELTCIGEIVRLRYGARNRNRILIIDERGRARPLKARGWDPFR